MIPVDDENIYCESCQLTHTIPNLDEPENIQYWRYLEQAKRRLFISGAAHEYYAAAKTF